MSARATFIEALNRRRIARGLHRLKQSVRLTGVARRQAKLMAHQGRIHHDNFHERVKGKGFRITNECVGYTVGKTAPRAMLKSFMDSPPHEWNLMFKQMTHTGVWAKRGAQKRVYWCVVCGGNPDGPLPDLSMPHAASLVDEIIAPIENAIDNPLARVMPEPQVAVS